DGGDVEVPIANRNAGRTLVPKALGDVHLAVAVRVAQSYDASRVIATALGGDIEIAIWHHHHVTRRTDIVGGHQRAKALRKFESAVIGIAGRQPGRSNVRKNRYRDCHSQWRAKQEAFHESSFMTADLQPRTT